MYLNHIALAASDSEEIENFYEDILEFSLKRKFLMDAGIASNFFGVNKEVDVYFMEKDDVGLEIFLYPEKRKKIFPHLCMEYPDCSVIYSRAQRRGYKAKVKNNPERNDTYFVWDKSGNMFELKEIKK
ncbi:MAG: VOC family protein [Prolixibacteraceae bacterium]|nr:VOC family protein [Prolixibacteraceae bacterium]